MGFLVAQAVHAAGESSPGNLPPNTNAVVLAVAHEQALLAFHERFRVLGVPHVLVREPDAPYLGQATAIGLVPGRRDVLRRHLSSLPLFHGEVAQSRAPVQSGDAGSRPALVTTPTPVAQLAEQPS